MTPLTVACLFVQGESPFTVDYVRRLRAMVGRWIDRPFEFVCLTDQPDAMPDGVEPIAITKLPHCFAYWTKLELFNPARQWVGRVLYLDLDTLIVAPIAAILDVAVPFALIDDPVGRRTVDRYQRRIVRRFNSSVMVWDRGTQTHLYTTWTPAAAARLSGDQDWIAEHAPNAVGLPASWFPRLSQVAPPPWDPDVKVILTKHPKNHVAVTQHPWFDAYWGAV